MAEELRVVVPEWATPGTLLQQVTPDGKELDLTVPEGVPPGSVMVLTQDPQTKAWRCSVELGDAPPAAPEPLSISVVVPEGAVPGTLLQQRMPDGKELDLKVPEGVPPGYILKLTQDPSSGSWSCTAEPPSETSPAAAPSAPPVPAAPAAPEPLTMKVPVPDWAVPGTTLHHKTPDGKDLDLTVPPGVPAGYILVLTQDPNSKSWSCTAEPPSEDDVGLQPPSAESPSSAAHSATHLPQASLPPTTFQPERHHDAPEPSWPSAEYKQPEEAPCWPSSPSKDKAQSPPPASRDLPWQSPSTRQPEPSPWPEGDVNMSFQDVRPDLLLPAEAVSKPEVRMQPDTKRPDAACQPQDDLVEHQLPRFGMADDAPKPSPLHFSFVVPEGCTPGSKLKQRTPDGMDLDLTVPPGVPPGSMLTFTRDEASGAWQCVAEPPDERGRVASAADQEASPLSASGGGHWAWPTPASPATPADAPSPHAFASQGRPSDARHSAEGRHSDGRHSDGRHSDGRHSDGRHSDGWPSDRLSEGRRSDARSQSRSRLPSGGTDGLRLPLQPERIKRTRGSSVGARPHAASTDSDLMSMPVITAAGLSAPVLQGPYVEAEWQEDMWKIDDEDMDEGIRANPHIVSKSAHFPSGVGARMRNDRGRASRSVSPGPDRASSRSRGMQAASSSAFAPVSDRNPARQRAASYTPPPPNASQLSPGPNRMPSYTPPPEDVRGVPGNPQPGGHGQQGHGQQGMHMPPGADPRGFMPPQHMQQVLPGPMGALHMATLAQQQAQQQMGMPPGGFFPGMHPNMPMPGPGMGPPGPGGSISVPSAQLSINTRPDQGMQAMGMRGPMQPPFGMDPRGMDPRLIQPMSSGGQVHQVPLLQPLRPTIQQLPQGPWPRGFPPHGPMGPGPCGFPQQGSGHWPRGPPGHPPPPTGSGTWPTGPPPHSSKDDVASPPPQPQQPEIAAAG